MSDLLGYLSGETMFQEKGHITELVGYENLLFIPHYRSWLLEQGRERTLAWPYLCVGPRNKGLDSGDKAFLKMEMKSPDFQSVPNHSVGAIIQGNSSVR